MNFTIPKGQEFYCMFVIKEPGSGTPMDITGATGLFNLSTIGFGCEAEIVDAPMVVEDAINGEISVTLTSTQTASLLSRIGFAEDGYPPIATYKGRIDITGTTNPISVDIPKVFISNMGCA